MNKYEELIQEAADNNVNVHDFRLEDNLSGLYVDGNVAIDTGIETTTEKTCVLAEELGHHHTTVGNILDLSDAQNAKQERQARLWAYNKQIGLRGIVNAFEHGCRSSQEIAEHLGVTDEFLYDAVECYRDKYGLYKEVDNYIIYFIPNLRIGKMI
ncbi:ImmA/IrrE family metallo-endopeptidase [Hespellia stercorisuis]|uniref:IrrE N-terminal-like domain-containing protein n=1 Tax=Hespellia stercorisuis DSM 15480 TaxID=1121950 RepID=A0A1M6TSV0_9FIRM|nr:ImmA/IrrE family metallo-endopeptidase [Hespellia stercorisuis]SHK59898.1 protein of unknown function [Hespellia stercorisuis DSM 15480]